MENLPSLEPIARDRAVAIVRTTSEESARLAARAVIDGGMRVVEITMNTPGALAVIAELATMSNILPGAGTVTDVATADRCLDAGARFIVSPTTDPVVISHVKKRGALMIPGAFSPTEVLAAWRAGADVVKIFPAVCVGGPTYFRLLAGPLPQVRLLPTGGVTLDDAVRYLEAGAFAVGLTSALFPAEVLARGDFDSVRTAARALMTRLGTLVEP